MNRTLSIMVFASLVLVSCSPAIQEEADARHAEVLEAEIAAMEPASAEEVTEPVVEEAPAVVPETPFEDTPGSTMRYRKVGSAGYCDVYEVQVAERSYILTQNSYYSNGTDVTCQIIPR